MKPGVSNCEIQLKFQWIKFILLCVASDTVSFTLSFIRWIPEVPHCEWFLSPLLLPLIKTKTNSFFSPFGYDFASSHTSSNSFFFPMIHGADHIQRLLTFFSLVFDLCFILIICWLEVFFFLSVFLFFIFFCLSHLLSWVGWCPSHSGSTWSSLGTAETRVLVVTGDERERNRSEAHKDPTPSLLRVASNCLGTSCIS